MRRSFAIRLVVFGIAAIATFVWAFPLYRAFRYEALSEACRDNDFPRVQRLIRFGADPHGAADYFASQQHQGFEFSSHVMVSVMHSDCRILRYLLSRRASADTPEGDGSTPLSYAISQHNIEAVRVLLAGGANPRYKPDWTAVDHARVAGHQDIIDVITPYLKP